MNTEERRRAFLALTEAQRNECKRATVNRILPMPVVLGIAVLGVIPMLSYGMLTTSPSKRTAMLILLCSALVVVLAIVLIIMTRAPRICDEELKKRSNKIQQVTSL